MDLRELLKCIEVIEGRPGPNQPVTSIAYHSGKVTPGSLFVCIRGSRTDGHLYLPEAIKNGAIAAVIEKPVDTAGIPQYRVADSRLALASLAACFYGRPSEKLCLTGVTATNGKTSTTYMINSIFEAQGLLSGLIGTIIVKIGDIVRTAELTTPESLDLQAMLKEMVERGVSHAVMEVSSSGLELKRVSSVDFDTVIINNIDRDHIDLHGSFEAYFEAKASLVREAKEGSLALLNLDCANTATLVGQTRARTITYGTKNKKADCTVEDLDLSTGRAHFTLVLKNRETFSELSGCPERFTLDLSVLGLHSVYNATAASLATLLNGIPVETIQKALHNFRGVERRFELIYEGEFMVIDDHADNAANVEVTLETLEMMKHERLRIVYAIRGNRGVMVNRENSAAIANRVPGLNLDRLIITTSRKHVGENDRVSATERQVFMSELHQSGLNPEFIEDLPSAIARGLEGIGPGDILLLGGSQGMDRGAAICLEQIAQANPGLEKEKIFAVLKNRVAGTGP